MNTKAFLILSAVALLCSCARKQPADLVLYNGRIYTVDSAMSVVEAAVITGATITATGSTAELLDSYDAKEKMDLGGKAVIPGIIDAHCHFVGYGLGLMRLNLTGTTSFNDVIGRLAAFTGKNNKPDAPGEVTMPGSDSSWIIGRGWDQNDWAEKKYPDRRRLDSLFPNRPVMLVRIDGHAALVNGAALRRAGITPATRISGGEILVENNSPTGVLIDNAVDLVKKVIPPPSRAVREKALQLAEKNCFSYGITTVDDAGLMKEDVELIRDLQDKKQLRMRVYAMLSDSQPNFDHFFAAGPLNTDRLTVRCIKLYADGALGSRGACLLDDYSDRKGSRGFLLSDPAHFAERCRQAHAAGFQVATHCIGDSAYRLMLRIYHDAGAKKADRWRIEHAQVTHPDDIKKSADIIPSVQPTHATSDMPWVEERLGKERADYAYAYNALLKAAGTIALGTDFPVEDISPLKTFYAAVTRQDSAGHPPGGFRKFNALSRETTLKGMTQWAAWSNFEEKKKGSIVRGKMADLVVLDQDIMTVTESQILRTRVVCTIVSGEKVFTR